MRMPTTISNQKNGAVAPVAMMASVSAPARRVRHSQRLAAHEEPVDSDAHGQQPARFDNSFLSVANGRTC